MVHESNRKIGVADSPTVDLPDEREADEPPPNVQFTNITKSAGIDFVHYSGARGDKLLPETMGGGCAFFDYDSDGDQDLLLVNSKPWPWDEESAETTSDLPTSAQTRTALYRNDGSGKFENVAQQMGIDVSLFGMGTAVGDYDNDGDVDVYISAVGKNRLFRNDGSRFTDVTLDAGVSGDDSSWSSSCGWFDYDNDGDLDLFVCNYVNWSRELDEAQGFQITGIGRAYGPPTAFSGSFPYLFRNDGDGKFTDVSESSGMHMTNTATDVPLGKSLGLLPIDLNRDGWIDVIVANDTVRNFVFLNQGDGTFREAGIELGIAFDSQGKARGAMGIDAARFRNDECLGVAIANFANEMTGLYVCTSTKSPMFFTDDAISTGIGPPTRTDLSFGLVFFDYDLDGRLDLLSANGHLENDINSVQSSQHYRQPSKLFWNAGPSGKSEFVEVQEELTGKDLAQPIVGRGASYADIDADGDLDVVLTQISGTPLLLRNDQDLGRAYLRLKLIGMSSNRDAIGAQIILKTPNGEISRQVMPTRSYLSQVELPITIGVTTIRSLEIVWPNGDRQVVDKPILGTTMEIEQARK